MSNKISAEMLVKQNSMFCAIYIILMPFYFEIWLVKLGVNFPNILRAAFSYKSFFAQLLCAYILGL
jgi:hypothetical protein